tara:strand:+ start:167 stop:511 length:345 start_codon:yes stop_codon:yes gene_type:complete
MARINTYIKDTNLTDADSLIGTDADQNNATSNFTLGGIKTYIETNANIPGETVTFVQSSASLEWVITHNLDKFPSVTVIDDTDNDVVFGDISYTNSNKLIINFSAPFSGKAFLN